MPRALRANESSVPGCSRRVVKRSRMSATDGITAGPTSSMTTSACPSSSDISAVSSSKITFCSGVWIASMTLTSASDRSERMKAYPNATSRCSVSRELRSDASSSADSRSAR